LVLLKRDFTCIEHDRTGRRRTCHIVVRQHSSHRDHSIRSRIAATDHKGKVVTQRTAPQEDERTRVEQRRAAKRLKLTVVKSECIISFFSLAIQRCQSPTQNRFSWQYTQHRNHLRHLIVVAFHHRFVKRVSHLPVRLAATIPQRQDATDAVTACDCHARSPTRMPRRTRCTRAPSSLRPPQDVCVAVHVLGVVQAASTSHVDLVHVTST
jgi:hypothetical protein